MQSKQTLAPHATEKPVDSASLGPQPVLSSALGSDHTINLVAAIWRYRWAVLIPIILGAVSGLLIHLNLPETYRSTTRLMLQSDKNVVLDQITGNAYGGVSGLAVVKSELFSDQVMEMAFAAPRMEPFRREFNSNLKQFTAVVSGSLTLQPEVEDLGGTQSLVALLHFNSHDKELCRAVVESFSEALQTYYSEKFRSSRGDLVKVISTGMDKFYSRMLELEENYRIFRRDAPLAWDAEGVAINPHRERQLFLVGKRSEIVENLRAKMIEIAALKSVANEASNDPILGLNIIGELLGKSFSLPEVANGFANQEQTDIQLALNKLEQDLVPLVIERNQVAAEFGESHPTVKSVDSQISTMRGELRKLVQEQTDRMSELALENKSDPKTHAIEAVKTIVFASDAQIQLLKEQIQEIDAQIEIENKGAAKLAQYEQEYHDQKREIARTRELLNQLEEQMDLVTLREEERGTQIIELKAPSAAYKIGPNIAKTIGLGSFLGILMGTGLALLLEKNANTFRDPDEISERLGVPILTHVPYFKGRIKKMAKGFINPYADFDPSLAVVHMPSSVASEAIRSCRTSVFFELGSGGGKVLQVTSPLPGDGKSTISGNLACSIAQSGKRILVIDGDLRRPQLTDNFGMPEKTGLTNVLNGETEPMDACHETPLQNLHVMPSGPIPTNPAEALTLPEMNSLIDLLRDKFDFIIIDTPPLLVVTDPSIIASNVDGVVMAMRVRRKSRQNSKEAISILRSVGAKIVGLVVNNSDDAGVSDGYKGYGYYQYGRYTHRYNRGGKSNAEKASGPSARITVAGRGGLQQMIATPIAQDSDSVGQVRETARPKNV